MGTKLALQIVYVSILDQRIKVIKAELYFCQISRKVDQKTNRSGEILTDTRLIFDNIYGLLFYFFIYRLTFKV